MTIDINKTGHDNNELKSRSSKAEFILDRKRFFIALSHAHFRFLKSRASYR